MIDLFDERVVAELCRRTSLRLDRNEMSGVLNNSVVERTVMCEMEID